MVDSTVVAMSSCMMAVFVIIVVVMLGFVILNGNKKPPTPKPKNPKSPKNSKNYTAVSSISCPTPWIPCSDPRFNTFNQGASAAMANNGLKSTEYCCRFSNAASDPRPSCKQTVASAQKNFSTLRIVFDVILGLIPIPGVGLLVDMSIGVAQSIITSFVVDAATNNGSAPMTSCQSCKSNFFDGTPAGSVIMKQYQDSDNTTQWGMWTTNDGCPILYSTPDVIRYTQYLSKALTTPWVSGQSNDTIQTDKAFPNAKKQPCTQGCTNIISYDDWLKRSKMPIGCYVTCPDNSLLSINKGVCNLTCDTSGTTSKLVIPPGTPARPGMQNWSRR